MSCHRHRLENIESRLSITPSRFPPFAGLSYSARARNPFGPTPCGGRGWGVKFPNNSLPLSMAPLSLRSRTSQASSEPDAVHAKRSAPPLLSRSKLTPPAASVRAKPSPERSIITGEEVNEQQHPLPKSP